MYVELHQLWPALDEQARILKQVHIGRVVEEIANLEVEIDCRWKLGGYDMEMAVNHVSGICL